MSHRVVTTHIQRLISNALTIAESANGAYAGDLLQFPQRVYDVTLCPSGSEVFHERMQNDAPVEGALEKAVADLRHAADELDAERLSCKGWSQH